MRPVRAARAGLGQLAIEPPEADTDNRRENQNNAAQDNERDETEHDRRTNCQSANNDHERVGDRVSSREAPLG